MNLRGGREVGAWYGACGLIDAMANPFKPAQKLERQKRLAALLIGALAGAALPSALGAVFGLTGGMMLVGSLGLFGAVVGAALGEALAPRVDMGPWEPISTGRSYVGVHAPDDVGAV